MQRRLNHGERIGRPPLRDHGVELGEHALGWKGAEDAHSLRKGIAIEGDDPRMREDRARERHGPLDWPNRCGLRWPLCHRLLRCRRRGSRCGRGIDGRTIGTRRASRVLGRGGPGYERDEDQQQSRVKTHGWMIIRSCALRTAYCHTANCELRTASCELRTANCELRTAN